MKRRNPIGVAVDALHPRAFRFQNGRAEISLVQEGQGGAGKPRLVGPDVTAARGQTGEHKIENQCAGQRGAKPVSVHARLGKREAKARLPANRYLRRFRRQAARLTPANPVESSTRVPGSGVTTVSNASANRVMASSPRQNKTAFIVPS